MSSLSQLLVKLRNEMKMDYFDKIWATSAKEDAVEKGYFQVQKDANFAWPENEDTASISLLDGTQEYAMPARTIHVTHVQLQSSRTPLTKTTKKQVLMIDNGEEGTPSEYYIYGGYFGVYPTPNANNTVNILRRKRLAPLSSTQDSEFPEDFDNPVVCYAAYELWKQTKTRDMAAAKYQDYKQALNSVRMTYLYGDMQDLSFGIERSKKTVNVRREA